MSGGESKVETLSRIQSAQEDLKKKETQDSEKENLGKVWGGMDPNEKIYSENMFPGRGGGFVAREGVLGGFWMGNVA